MARYMSSSEAAQRLGVSRQTLYAYVSRGLLQAAPGATHRDRQYLAADVERLAAERARVRKPKEVAKATLNWGLPVLESAITLIENERIYYRGHDAVALAASSDLESLAALLWQSDVGVAFTSEPPAWADPMPALLEHYRDLRTEHALLPLVTVATDDAATAQSLELDTPLFEGCGALVRLFAACVLRRAPSAASIHLQCAAAWGVGDAGASLIRTALVLCADHELNASGFTARCVASTGASVRASLIGGLAALTGGKHGAATAHVEAMWDAIDAQGLAQTASIVDSLQSDIGGVPGFGHHLYAGGDPRAHALLAHILPDHPRWVDLVEAISARSGQYPSIDFALVALRRHLGLPLGAGFGIFALGRTVGWIAHALEQRADPSLIRPRAAYVGRRPKSDLAAANAGQSKSANSPKSASNTMPARSSKAANARFGPFSGLFLEEQDSQDSATIDTSLGNGRRTRHV